MEMTLETIAQADAQSILSLSKKTNLHLPTGSSVPEQIARYSAIQALVKLMETVTSHSGYVGKDGKASTSAKGFVIQINKRIKDLFGYSVKEIRGERNLLRLRTMREAAACKIVDGEALKLSRSQIKQNVYSVIETAYHLFD